MKKFYNFFIFLIKIAIQSINIRVFFFLNKKKLNNEIIKKINSHIHNACKKGIKQFKIDLKVIKKAKSLPSNYLIISNHQSLFDIILLYGILKPNISFIAKESLFHYPFLGSGMKILNHIPINRKNRQLAYQSILKGASRLNQNYSIVIFPEGTRVTDGLAPFKSGAFHIINNLPQVNVLPITICGTKNIHQKNWFYFKPGKVKVVIHQPKQFKNQAFQSSQRRKTMIQKIEKIIASDFENDY